MTECGCCAGSGVEPIIGGLCARCNGSGKRRPGSDPEVVSRAQTIHCLCGFPVFGCPAQWGNLCPPRQPVQP